MPTRPALECLDHLIYATRDLEATVADLERRLGARATPGGRHLGRGTRNALIALGPTTYLEILAPDFDQPEPATPRWLAVDSIERPKLGGWAIRCGGVAELAARAERAGVKLGAVGAGSRERTDGVLLKWTYTDPRVMIAGGIVPFLIDWGGSPHPAASAPVGPPLQALRAEHPEPEPARLALSALGVDLDVGSGPRPALIAVFRLGAGLVELS
jgi:hypothetical protein